MKTESKNLLERQALWQKTRKNESWADKLKKSAQARDSLSNFASSSRKSITTKGPLTRINM